ncbi:GAF domain-containing protein [Promicromonospora sp. CA-289599]|uniref:GAF domain-containing sensor histidine kinase n=1 Tax=Promicromonospora sp. CA-289599 TaxID=3240014 RepID=UPI003D8BA7B4
MNDESFQFPDVPLELESTIGELIERAHKVQAAHGRLRDLLRANRIVVGDLELEQVLHRIVDAAVTLVDAQYGALGVIDADGGLERFIHVGMSDDAAREIGHLPEGHGILGAVIDCDGPIRLEDLGADPRSIGFPAHHPPMGAFLGVPIRVRDATYGNLYLTNRADGPFSAEDEELVTALAATAAVAIDNARLYEQSRRAQRLSKALAEVTATLLAPETADAFGAVAERVVSLVDADLVTVVVPAGDGELLVDTARGVGADAHEGATMPADDSVVAEAISGGHIVSSDEVIGTSALGEQPTGGSSIAVPLIVSGTPVGALCVSRGAQRPRFSADDRGIVSEFAAQAGLAVALAWARADRQRLDVIEDRARIARDLHDHVIQRLFGAGLGLQALAARAPEHAVTIDRHIADLDAAIGDIRTAIFALQTRPTSESVRRRLLDVTTEIAPSLRSPPRITFSGPVDLVVIGPLADDVLAVVREALANVARHAQASTAEVSLTATMSEVVVIVDDDGVGIPPRIARASGTANLTARARSRGGTFVLERRDSSGTRARWHVPLAPVPRSSRQERSPDRR